MKVCKELWPRDGILRVCWAVKREMGCCMLIWGMDRVSAQGLYVGCVKTVSGGE